MERSAQCAFRKVWQQVNHAECGVELVESQRKALFAQAIREYKWPTAETLATSEDEFEAMYARGER